MAKIAAVNPKDVRIDTIRFSINFIDTKSGAGA
jgi:hypothetical protein